VDYINNNTSGDARGSLLSFKEQKKNSVTLNSHYRTWVDWSIYDNIFAYVFISCFHEWKKIS